MSHRLQVLIPDELDLRLRKAAQRARVSKGEWVRRAIEESLKGPIRGSAGSDPLEQLERLRAPTADIKTMISEIESGRL